MSGGMYGADVAQLRALAAQFSQAADQLDRGRLQVGNGIRISAWVGPFATSFRLRWDSEHSLRVAGVARRLRDGASRLRAKADQQERASAVDGAGTPSVAVPRTNSVSPGRPDPSPEGANDLDLWLERFGGATFIGGLGQFVAELKELRGAGLAGKILGPLGVFGETIDVVGRINSSDGWGAFRHTASLGASATAMVVAKLNPMAAGIGALNALIDFAIPTTGAQQQGTLDKGAEILFGRGATATNLTPEQSSALTKRYTGVWGPMNMISDTMDATADRLFPWNWGTK